MFKRMGNGKEYDLPFGELRKEDQGGFGIGRNFPKNGNERELLMFDG